MTSRLSSDQLGQLTPLLGSLARLVFSGSQLSESELHTLLLGADLETEPSALQELQRWGRLLTALRDQPSGELRRATVEALMLRGLPEAPVLLAVDTVSSKLEAATSQAPPSQSQQLTASVASLDFGALPPGQVAMGEFEVQGGPGQIVVESEQVQVTPLQFGAETTRVRVEAKPSSGGLLWTSLKLVTAGETVEVPVVAQWEDSPATAVAGPTDALVVEPGGGGTHRTLAEALSDAEPGATIYLRPGTHQLGHGLLLRQAVTLVGEGKDVTGLVAEQGNYVLRYEGEGLFGLFDLAVQWRGAGPEPADVVTVHNGAVQIERCRFSGATFGDELWGAGLELGGSVRGRVGSCEMQGNGHGVIVGEQAQVTLNQNSCTGNENHGILLIFAQAQTTLESNTCRDNQSSGIFYFGTCAGTALNNTCTGNEKNGIYVGGRAQLTLEGNTCTGNGSSGIYVSWQAQPTLEGNTCRENNADGISYYGGTSSTARNNTCTGNEQNGIRVTGQAQPTLEGNTCRENKSSGISYSGSTFGTARNNTCRENNADGISIRDEASPRVIANSCEKNGEDGIYVASSARPALKGNRCNNNKGQDVNDERPQSVPA